LIWTPFAVSTGATLLGIAALISALGGFASTMLAIRTSRHEERAAGLEQLTAREEELAKCRATSEELARELHKVRMGEYES